MFSKLDPFFVIPPYHDVPPDITSALAAITAHRSFLSRQERRIVVFGALKAGKSSVLNALLGTSLLPVRSHQISGAVATIRHGSVPAATIVRDQMSDESIPFDQVAETLRRDMGSNRTIAAIRVELPHPLLANRCVLVDTPGLLGEETLAERAQCEIERADLGVMVLAADKILSARERDVAGWATTLLNGNVLYVVNRLDLIDDQDCTEVLDWARDALYESGNELVGRPRIFATSAKSYEGIADFGWWLTGLFASDAGDKVVALSRLGILEAQLLKAQQCLAPHLEQAGAEAQHARDEEEGRLARERAAIRGEIAQARVRLRRVADDVTILGEHFIDRCVEDTLPAMRNGSDRHHRAPVQYKGALARYVDDSTSAAREALLSSPVTAPAFDLSGWIFRDWVDPATHPTHDLGVTLGDLATRVVDGGGAGREAGATIGGWIGKNVFGVDIERETLNRIRHVASAAEQALRAEAHHYFDRVDALLTDADAYYATWTRAAPQVAAAEDQERMYKALSNWCQEFVKEVRSVGEGIPQA